MPGLFPDKLAGSLSFLYLKSQMFQEHKTGKFSFQALKVFGIQPRIIRPELVVNGKAPAGVAAGAFRHVSGLCLWPAFKEAEGTPGVQ